MKKTDKEQLHALPEYRRLLQIARSDNPLIALAVTKREVCWTQFLQWLLDPIRHPGNIGKCFLDILLKQCAERSDALPEPLAGAGVSEIVSVRAEVSEGKAGRSDLIVECRVRDTPVEILIENKIDSKERKDQLADYAGKRLRKLPDNATLIPTLSSWEKMRLAHRRAREPYAGAAKMSVVGSLPLPTIPKSPVLVCRVSSVSTSNYSMPGMLLRNCAETTDRCWSESNVPSNSRRSGVCFANGSLSAIARSLRM